MRVIKDKCIGCGGCVSFCPVEAIRFDEDGRAKIDREICIQCGGCKGVCPVEAITDKEESRDQNDKDFQ